MDDEDTETDHSAAEAKSKAIRLLRKSMGTERMAFPILFNGTSVNPEEEGDEDGEDEHPEPHLEDYQSTRPSASRHIVNKVTSQRDSDEHGHVRSASHMIRYESDYILESGPSFQLSSSSHAGISLLEQLHHNLKPREEDILFLKKRILFPGIFETESSDEDSRPKRNLRRIPCKPFKAEPTSMDRKKKPEDEICGGESSSTLGKKMSGMSRNMMEKSSQQQSIGCIPASTSKLLTKPLRPQDESICPDQTQKRIFEAHHSVVKIEWKHTDEDDYTDGGTMVAGSDMSLNEKLCLLEEEAKKPVSMKERYVGHRSIPGYPKCLDRTMAYQECLPPGEVVRRAIDTQKLWGIPEGVTLTRDQLVELIVRLEQHQNNDYVCLVYAFPFSHSEYNPYSLKVVRYNDVGNRIHYTLSHYGALLISNGMAEYISMLQVHMHMRCYDTVRSLPFFYNYRIWKAFYLWRHTIRQDKIRHIKFNISRNLFVTKRPLRIMLLELSKMCDKLATIPLLNIPPHGESKSLPEFVQSAIHHLDGVSLRLRAFEKTVMEMTRTVCRATLMEEGFSPDQYPEELEFCIKQLEIPVQSFGKNLDVVLEYPGQWLTFSQQLKKRDVCKRITEFIRLVDYYVQRAYHKLLKNSMFLLVLEMHARLPGVPQPYYTDFDEEEVFNQLQTKIDLYFGTPSLSEVTEPMLEIGCDWNDEGLVLSPSLLDYVKGWRTVLGAWQQITLSYKNMLSIPQFNPYTQPVINGNIELKTCGEGPSFELFLDLDYDLESLAIIGENILRHNFQMSEQYIDSLKPVCLFCLENEKLDMDILRNETDVDKLQLWLEKFTDQEAILQQVEEFKSMGVFRVNNSILHAQAIPTIEKCMEVVREVMPASEEEDEEEEEEDEDDEEEAEEHDEEQEQDAEKQDQEEAAEQEDADEQDEDAEEQDEDAEEQHEDELSPEAEEVVL